MRAITGSIACLSLIGYIAAAAGIANQGPPFLSAAATTGLLVFFFSFCAYQIQPFGYLSATLNSLCALVAIIAGHSATLEAFAPKGLVYEGVKFYRDAFHHFGEVPIVSPNQATIQWTPLTADLMLTALALLGIGIGFTVGWTNLFGGEREGS